MIEYKKGCLIKAFKGGEVDVIAHQCSAFHTMGAGVAKAIAQEFPHAEAADKATEYGSKALLGWFTYALTDYGYIYNLYGQYGCGKGGRHTNYDHLENALLGMKHDLLSRGYKGKIGLPKIGCGLAGGDWDVVKYIIQDVFYGDYDVIVYEL